MGDATFSVKISQECTTPTMERQIAEKQISDYILIIEV